MAKTRFSRVLIANRGTIACRIIRTLQNLNIDSLGIFTEVDATSLHVRQVDQAILIGGSPQAYLDGDAILAAALEHNVDAIHPGYGFLSENADFAEACEASGIAFIGPTPETIRTFGRKHTARALAKEHNVPMAPGSDLLRDGDQAVAEAERLGFPVMIKATAGGGGIGMQICGDADAVANAYQKVQRQGEASFGDAGVFLERFVANARHIEVQIFGDGSGRTVALGERDCSLQRRNQKVIEETPAPHLSEESRHSLHRSAQLLGNAARYRSAGTVEFLYDVDRDDFSFLEVNTRLQVEHGVTEEAFGIDLVNWMVRGAAGDYEFLDRPLKPVGTSIQARLYAEDPSAEYRPSSGTLTQVSFPANARTEHWIEAGTDVTAHYDPMLGKLISKGATREVALNALKSALDNTSIEGVVTNLDWLRTVICDADVQSARVTTKTLETIDYRPRAIRVISGGPATSVQDVKGRLGAWNVGVPPSGAMDGVALSLANRLIGNDANAAGLEFTGLGPTLQFESDAQICLGGADFGAVLDGQPISAYLPFRARRGQILTCGRVSGPGFRGYLAIEGGIDVAPYLGSRSTFTLGQFGGYSGRTLAAGDLIALGKNKSLPKQALAVPKELPPLAHDWQVRVMLGPHAAPDFFTDADVETLLAADWRVHYNSSRTGVRLVGPKPDWARRDGGEAGLHPSNIHDNAYAIGAVDFTGDMPILLGPDGPSLGGFVCPFVTITADLWKLGQLAPDDTVRLQLVSPQTAENALTQQEKYISGERPALSPPRPTFVATPANQTPVLYSSDATKHRPAVTYRHQGDANILVEYGPIILDIELRVRVHALMEAIQAENIAGIIDVTPGIRSLQVHFDPQRIKSSDLLERLRTIDAQIVDLDDFEVPSRTVHLPLCWEDPAVQQTIDKYIQSVRDDAPWCPDNIEFIRRINGLDTREDVYRTVYEAEYLVIGLGDVYLGAPVATPLDPRHRLVTTKYNPARTWTPPNVVGIGGAYLCIYGMEGPGGYQLFGRTIPVWNTYRTTQSFSRGTPWLLRFFDRIRFFPVSDGELRDWRRDFPLGRREIDIEDGVFRLGDHRTFVASNATSIEAFQRQRENAFNDERMAWEKSGEFDRTDNDSQTLSDANEANGVDVPEGSIVVESPLSGSLWHLSVCKGDRVQAGETIAVVEAMKTECPIISPVDGTISALLIAEKDPVSSGLGLIAINEDRG